MDTNPLTRAVSMCQPSAMWAFQMSLEAHCMLGFSFFYSLKTPFLSSLKSMVSDTRILPPVKNFELKKGLSKLILGGSPSTPSTEGLGVLGIRSQPRTASDSEPQESNRFSRMWIPLIGILIGILILRPFKGWTF